MQLAIHSDASYLSFSQAQIQARGVHFLSKGPPNPNNPEDFVPTVNVILLVVCNIMSNIMASSAEAEYGTIFVIVQPAEHIRITLTEMGRKQGPTDIQVDNFTTVGIATKEFHQNKSMVMDMYLYRINDIIEQGTFRVFSKPGPKNLGDYHSKYYPPDHHIAV